MAFLRCEVAFNPDLLTAEISDDPQLFGDSAFFYNDGKPANEGAFFITGQSVGGGFVTPVISAYGEKYAYDSSDMPTGGTIEGIEVGAFIGQQYERGFSVSGLDLSAKTFANALASETLKDDVDVIKSIFKGKDSLFGSGSDDILDGFKGRDTLVGGDGDDSFRFTTSASGDHIDDFKRKDDSIQLDDKVFDELSGGVKKSMFTLGLEAKNDDHRLIYDKGTGSLFYDADGKGGDAQKLVAVFDNLAELKAADIDII